MNEKFDPVSFHELCEEALEKRLTPERRDELERIVQDHVEARRYYVEAVTQHLALLKYSRTIVKSPPVISVRIRDRQSGQYRLGQYRLGQYRLGQYRLGQYRLGQYRLGQYRFVRILVSIVFVCLGIGAVIHWSKENRALEPELPERTIRSTLPKPVEQPEPGAAFGVLHEQGEPLWSEDSNALREDRQVGPGLLHLREGVAQIKFDQGVLLTVESPTRMTIYSKNRCFLHSGRVFAAVSPEGVGFIIETGVAEIKDLGTEFGVCVEEGREAEVQVFSGRVDIRQKDQVDFIPITTGGWLRFDRPGKEPYSPHQHLSKQAESDSETNEFVCTTADGDGREACVLSGGILEQLNPQMKGSSAIFTLLKNAASNADWHRKGYIAFDLSKIPRIPYRDVQLELTFAPTGVGVLAHAPETSMFTVYGLLDESGDQWTEENISWAAAPGNDRDGAEVDPDKTIKIASFTIDRDDAVCRRIVSGEALRQFLNKDTNHRVTFIVVRDTEEIGPLSYAHGFANRHHPKLPPPTLRFFTNSIDPSP